MKASHRCMVAAALIGGPAWGTTKGLNQIVTPDIQPVGVLSLSYQMQHESIGNSIQFQSEYGVTPRFEIAVFEGVRPGVQTLATEYGILSKGPYLLSTGFTSWSTRGDRPQPFLEGGYYVGPHKAMAGIVRNRSHSQTVVGYAYQATKDLLLQVDYQSGEGNSSTAGFTYNITPSLSLNPALYFTNDSPRHTLGYAVLTWNIKLS
jgi:hypothetical protein